MSVSTRWSCSLVSPTGSNRSQVGFGKPTNASAMPGEGASRHLMQLLLRLAPNSARDGALSSRVPHLARHREIREVSLARRMVRHDPRHIQEHDPLAYVLADMPSRAFQIFM